MINKPTKSAFAPMRPSIVAAKPSVAPSARNSNGEGDGPDSETRTPAIRVTIAEMDVLVRLLPVPVLADGAAVVARSVLELDGKSRGILIHLNRGHVLVARALSRADSLLIRYLIAQAIAAFSVWFKERADGRAVTKALRSLCGIPRDAMLLNSAFVTRLSACEAFRSLDQLPIYGPSPKEGPFTLFSFRATLRTPSDIPNWKALSRDAKQVKGAAR
jgi:hypothetical protein